MRQSLCMIEKGAMSSVAVRCRRIKNSDNETCVNKSVLYEFGLCINVATILRFTCFRVFGANYRSGVARCCTTSCDDAEIASVSLRQRTTWCASCDVVRCSAQCERRVTSDVDYNKIVKDKRLKTRKLAVILFDYSQSEKPKHPPAYLP